MEPNPIIYERLRKKNRKAYLINACIHDKPFPAKVCIVWNYFQYHELNVHTRFFGFTFRGTHMIGKQLMVIEPMVVVPEGTPVDDYFITKHFNYFD